MIYRTDPAIHIPLRVQSNRSKHVDLHTDNVLRNIQIRQNLEGVEWSERFVSVLKMNNRTRE